MTTKDKTTVVPITKNLPAERKVRHRWRTLDALADDADDLADRSDEIYKTRIAVNFIRERLDGGQPLATTTALPSVALSERELDLLADCRAALALLDPEGHYDDDGDLTRQKISERLAILVGNFPAGAQGEIYLKGLLEHVVAEDGLKYVALDAGCRAVEAEKTFRPSIAEVLTAIRAQQELWDRRAAAINYLDMQANDLAKEIAKLTPRFEAAAAAARVQHVLYDLDRARAQHKRAAESLANKETLFADLIDSADKLIKTGRADLAECEAAVKQKTAALAEATANAESKAKAADRA